MAVCRQTWQSNARCSRHLAHLAGYLCLIYRYNIPGAFRTRRARPTISWSAQPALAEPPYGAGTDGRAREWRVRACVYVCERDGAGARGSSRVSPAPTGTGPAAAAGGTPCIQALGRETPSESSESGCRARGSLHVVEVHAVVVAAVCVCVCVCVCG